MTAGQTYTPSPAAITKYATRNVYMRDGETSTILAGDTISSDRPDDPTSEFMVTPHSTEPHKVV
jgi:hypothetical protein